jgi:hypothetical protein
LISLIGRVFAVSFMIDSTATTFIADYVTVFTKLVDQLKAYSQSTDPMFYTMRFIDGLRADIKAIVLVLRPKDLDIACTVAMLQEEAGSAAPLRSHRSVDWSSTPRSPAIPRMDLPLPLPPPPPKHALTPPAPSSASDSKLAAIKSYRRALGLCYKCGVKWSKDHKCALEVCMWWRFCGTLLLRMTISQALKFILSLNQCVYSFTLLMTVPHLLLLHSPFACSSASVGIIFIPV